MIHFLAELTIHLHRFAFYVFNELGLLALFVQLLNVFEFHADGLVFAFYPFYDFVKLHHFEYRRRQNLVLLGFRNFTCKVFVLGNVGGDHGEIGGKGRSSSGRF